MKFRPKFTENGTRYTSLQGKFSDDSGDEAPIPLQPKKETPTMDVEINPDDTLQAIALKFHCTIAELKRINNILRDNEIYARRTIRVPVKPHSLLSELIVGVHVSGNSSPVTSDSDVQLIDLDTEALEKIIKKAEPASDLSVINNLLHNSKVDEVQAQLSNHEYLPISENGVNMTEVVQTKPLVQKLFTSGDDCGMSWLALIILVILLGVVCPLIYILYIAEHPEKFHHH